MKHLTEDQILFLHNAAAAKGLQVHIDLHTHVDIYIKTSDPASIHAGMQILYEEGIYEVSQYQAGKKANELHIYTRTPKLAAAFDSLIKGNKGRRAIEKW